VEKKVDGQAIANGDDRSGALVGVGLARRGDVRGERCAELLLVCCEGRQQLGSLGARVNE
jgi:hypothetical protein